MSADSPITLDEACALYPGARYKVSTLRAAADRGELVIFLLGRRYHTTPADMADWVARCREKSPRLVSISTLVGATGSSETEQVSSARAAVSETVERLKGLSKPTSAASIGRSRPPRRSLTMS
jgi:hypothetical protein